MSLRVNTSKAGGWSLFWYREGDVIFVQAAPSVRVTLKPKHPVK
jgi:hypothetical protein